MNTAPQPLFFVCEIPLKSALAIGATSAGRFAHLLSTPEMDRLREHDLLDRAEPFITTDPDHHTVALEVAPCRGTMTGMVDNFVVPSLMAIARADKEAAAVSEANERAIRAFLKESDELATGNDPRYLERYDAGVLPALELHAVIREALFGGSPDLEKAPRFRRLQVEDFQVGRRPQVCPSATARHNPTFEVTTDVVLDPAEFEVYQRIAKAAQYVAANAKEAIGLENVTTSCARKEHVMKCSYSHIPCTATMRRKSVMVMFTWAGITVGRELALEPAK
jgi:hypothetical protein